MCDGQILGSLPLMWQTQVELQTPDICLGQAWLLQAFGSEAAEKKIVSPSLFATLVLPLPLLLSH